MYTDPELPIVYFDSIAEQARVARDILHDAERSSNWRTGVTDFDETFRLAHVGDDSIVAQAEKLMDEFNFVAETTGKHYEPSHCGAFPVVPDYLRGDPMCMRQMRTVTNESMPIRIAVGCTGSGGLSQEAMTKRGIAIIALVMAIAKSRPVTLEMICSLTGVIAPSGEDYVITRAQVQTAPLDLAGAGFAVSNTTFQVAMGYGICGAVRRGKITKPDGTRYAPGNSSGWQILDRGDGRGPRFPSDVDIDAYHARMKTIMGLGDEDIYVPEIYGTDPIIEAGPAKWVRDCLRGINLIVEDV